MTPGLYLWRLREGSPAFLVRVFDGEAFPMIWYGTRGGYWGRLATAGGVFRRVTEGKG
jgi:hypothetical protein